jgi:pimeloyl-ACP methyl ester carboxylesterase
MDKTLFIKRFKLLFASFALMSACSSDKLPAENQARIDKEFKKEKLKPTIKYYKIGERNIATLQIGDDKLPITIFLHGSPGSGSDYDGYLKDSSLYSKTKLIVIDRPGYGFSDFGNIEPNVNKQAEIIQKIIEELKPTAKINLVGYSYGGPVAARLASVMPNKIKNVLLISASIAPGEEKIFKISYLAIQDKVKNKIPTILRMANEEKMTHKASLEEIAGDLDKIVCPVYVLHGNKDNLIYFTNVAYDKKMMKNAKVETYTVEGQGHGFFFSETKLITSYLQKMI